MSAALRLSARRGYFAVATIVILLDQASKIMAHARLRGRGAVEIIPGFLNLDYSRNPGGLFGYFGQLPDPWRLILLTVLPLLAIVVVALMLARSDEVDRRSLTGLALILGGAVGNLIDRVVRGEVVDFLDVYVAHPGMARWFTEYFGTAHWPTFNVADSAIVCGAGLLLLSTFAPEPVAAGQRAGAAPADDAPGAG